MEEHLALSFIYMEFYITIRLFFIQGQTEKELEDEITAMPQFPGITNLTVRFYSKKGSHFRAIATGLLQRCSNLRYLHLDVHLVSL